MNSVVAGAEKLKYSFLPKSERAASIACFTAKNTHGLKQRGGSPTALAEKENYYFCANKRATIC